MVWEKKIRGLAGRSHSNWLFLLTARSLRYHNFPYLQEIAFALATVPFSNGLTILVAYIVRVRLIVFKLKTRFHCHTVCFSLE